MTGRGTILSVAKPRHPRSVPTLPKPPPSAFRGAACYGDKEPPGVVGGGVAHTLHVRRPPWILRHEQSVSHAFCPDRGRDWRRLHSSSPPTFQLPSLYVARPHGAPDTVKRGTQHTHARRSAQCLSRDPDTFWCGGHPAGRGLRGLARWPVSITGWRCICHNGGSLRVITQWRAEFATRSLASRPATCRGRLPIYKPRARLFPFLLFRRKRKPKMCPVTCCCRVTGLFVVFDHSERFL